MIVVAEDKQKLLSNYLDPTWKIRISRISTFSSINRHTEPLLGLFSPRSSPSQATLPGCFYEQTTSSHVRLLLNQTPNTVIYGVWQKFSELIADVLKLNTSSGWGRGNLEIWGNLTKPLLDCVSVKRTLCWSWCRLIQGSTVYFSSCRHHQSPRAEPNQECVMDPICLCAAEPRWCPKAMKTHQWATLLHWGTCSSITINTYIVLYWASVPHTAAWCHKYSLELRMWIHQLLKTLFPLVWVAFVKNNSEQLYVFFSRTQWV